MTTADILSRAASLVAHRPRIKYGHHGEDHAQWPWPPDDDKVYELDCTELVCLCMGVQKDDGPGGWPWWSANAIYHDATHEQKFWKRVPFAVGVGVVYAGAGMGHCGIVVDGPEDFPRTVESAFSKKGVWRGRRPHGFWQRKNAVFVVPVEV